MSAAKSQAYIFGDTHVEQRQDITPHIPVWERYERTEGMFSRLAFTYDAERDVYICPNGRFLRTTGTVHDGRVRNYLSQSGECRVCELKGRCNAPHSERSHVISTKKRAITSARAAIAQNLKTLAKPHLATTTGHAGACVA